MGSSDSLENRRQGRRSLEIGFGTARPGDENVKVLGQSKMKVYFLVRLCVFFSVALAAACFPSVIKHNQNHAAKAAEAFSQLALVERNFSEASRLVTRGSSDEVGRMVEQLHPSAKYPVSVVAASYEPVRGKESIKIYLEGSGADPTYHYLAIMDGTEPTGYKVSAINRSKDPFPASNDIKPLR